MPLTIFVYLRSNFSGGRRKTSSSIYFYKRGVSAVQGHSRSLTSVPVESAYVTSY